MPVQRIRFYFELYKWFNSVGWVYLFINRKKYQFVQRIERQVKVIFWLIAKSLLKIDPDMLNKFLVRSYCILYNTTMFRDLSNFHGYLFKLLGDPFYYNVLCGAVVGGAWVMELKEEGERGRRSWGGEGDLAPKACRFFPLVYRFSKSMYWMTGLRIADAILYVII